MLLLAVCQHVSQLVQLEEGGGGAEGDGLHEISSEDAVLLRGADTCAELMHPGHVDWRAGWIYNAPLV